MRLEDLLAITSEHQVVNVVNYSNNAVLSRYDGKDSVNSKYNDKDVVRQYVEDNELFIVVWLEEK